MANGFMLKGCLLTVMALVCWASEDALLPVEHRGDPDGVALVEPGPVIETELEAQLRDALSPGLVATSPQYQYRPLYPAWPLYPVPAVYSAGAGVGAQPVTWYLSPVVRDGLPYPYRVPGLAERRAPSLVASMNYDVTFSSAHAPQQPE